MQSLYTSRSWERAGQKAIIYPPVGTRGSNGCRRATAAPGVEPEQVRHSLNPRILPLPGIFTLRVASALAAAACALPVCRASDDSQIAAVSSQVSGGYSRVKLANGSFVPETYTFGEGGRLAGSADDPTIDRLTFLDVATAIAGPLEKRGFVPVGDRNPEKTKLLIMVYWGTTTGTERASDSLVYQSLQRSQGSKPPPPTQPPSGGAASAGPGASQQARQSAAVQNSRQANEDGAMAAVLAENWQREQFDMKNAMLLGYDKALAETSDVGATPLSRRHDDLVSEIEEDRYFIVLMAYDYQALWTRRKHSLLWVTRFSVRARGSDFERLLPSMVGYASQYFGQDSHGLLRRELPEGHVEVGEPRSLGPLPEK